MIKLKSLILEKIKRVFDFDDTLVNQFKNI